jgi:plastocyanin
MNPFAFNWVRNACVVCLTAWASHIWAASLAVQVLDRNGDPVPNAVVTVQALSSEVKSKTPVQTVVIDQEKMRFMPEVTVVSVGSTVRLVNKDPWDHHIRSQPTGQSSLTQEIKSFEVRLPGRTSNAKPASQEIKLSEAGPLLLSCHIHGSMRGFLFVTQAPYFGKTDEKGQIKLDGMADGLMTLRVWHPDQLLDMQPDVFQLTGHADRVAKLTVVPRKRRL